jgi:hypothetical protein
MTCRPACFASACLARRAPLSGGELAANGEAGQSTVLTLRQLALAVKFVGGRCDDHRVPRIFAPGWHVAAGHGSAEELVDLAHEFGEEKLSAVVNTALSEHVERLGRLATLRQLLDRWEAQAGPVPPAVRADAVAAFDEADAGPSIAAG